MLLNEIFDTSVPVIWKETGTGWNGYLKLNNGSEYVIQIDNYDIQLSDKTLNTFDVGFSALRDGNMTLDLLGNKKSSSIIFGAVINGVKKFVSNKSPDILFFASHKKVSGYENRLPIYRSIMTWVSKHIMGAANPIEFTNSDGTYFVLLLTRLSEEQNQETLNLITKASNK